MNTCFLPQLSLLLQQYRYYGRAFLIMDGYKSHKNAIKIIDLVRENLVIHYLTAHTFDQSHPLDLGVFGCMKQYESNYKYDESLSKAANKVLKIHISLYDGADPINCRAAFRVMVLYIAKQQLLTYDKSFFRK